uniref:Uncharacterized protein n=1 Tax=Amphimedon queenslandica TaxID=400682 RepID=A0A1X7UQR3_AMPQE
MKATQPQSLEALEKWDKKEKHPIPGGRQALPPHDIPPGVDTELNFVVLQPMHLYCIDEAPEEWPNWLDHFCHVVKVSNESLELPLGSS